MTETRTNTNVDGMITVVTDTVSDSDTDTNKSDARYHCVSTIPNTSGNIGIIANKDTTLTFSLISLTAEAN